MFLLHWEEDIIWWLYKALSMGVCRIHANTPVDVGDWWILVLEQFPLDTEGQVYYASSRDPAIQLLFNIKPENESSLHSLAYSECSIP